MLTKGAEKIVEWQHDKLAEDLALAIQTPFLNIPLGSVWGGQFVAAQKRQDAVQKAKNREEVLESLSMPAAGTQLADVVAVKPSYTRFCLSIYEIKVSRADFQSDVRSEKYKGYLDHSHRLYFATPAGMVTKDEIPEEAGWIVRGTSGWKVMKAAPAREINIPEETMMSLIFKKQYQTVRERRTERLLKYSYNRKNQLKVVGKDLAEAWACREKYRNLADTYEDLIDQVSDAIRDGLGVEPDSPKIEMITLKNLVRQIKEKGSSMGIEPTSKAIPRKKMR